MTNYRDSETDAVFLMVLSGVILLAIFLASCTVQTNIPSNNLKFDHHGRWDLKGQLRK